MVDVVSPVDPDGIGVLKLEIADVVGEQKPGLTSLLEVQRGAFDLLLERHDRLRIQRPRSVEITRPRDAYGALEPRGADRGRAEELQVLIAMEDHRPGVGLIGVVGTGDPPKRHHVKLLRPRPRRRGSLCLHRVIRGQCDPVWRRARVRRAEVEHVPDITLLISHAVGRRAGVVRSGRPELEHRAVLVPGQTVGARRLRAQPAGGTRRVVVHVVGAFVLENPDVPRAVDVTLIRPVAVE